MSKYSGPIKQIANIEPINANNTYVIILSCLSSIIHLIISGYLFLLAELFPRMFHDKRIIVFSNLGFVFENFEFPDHNPNTLGKRINLKIRFVNP
jgi:hypothetical protein